MGCSRALVLLEFLDLSGLRCLGLVVRGLKSTHLDRAKDQGFGFSLE